MTAQLNAFDEMADLMVAGMNAERLIAYQVPQKLLDRYLFLTEKLKSDGLSKEEENELMSLLMVNQVISLAKVRMTRKMAEA